MMKTKNQVRPNMMEPILTIPCYVLVDADGKVPDKTDGSGPCVFAREEWANRTNEKLGDALRVVKANAVIYPAK